VQLGVEGESFVVPANSRVRYGASATDRYEERMLSGAFVATNVFFGGDPAPGARKQVYLLNDGSTVLITPAATPAPQPLPSPLPITGLNWSQVGIEDAVVTVPANSVIRYGAGPTTRYVEFIVSGTFVATNAYFGGDPAPYTDKFVYLLTGAATPPAPAPAPAPTTGTSLWVESTGYGAATFDTAPVIRGNLAAPLGAGQFVKVSRDGVAVGLATIVGSSWVIGDRAVTTGTHLYTAQVVNAQGTGGPVSAPYKIIVVPQQPFEQVPRYRVVDLGQLTGADISYVRDIKNNGSLSGSALFGGTSAGFVAQGDQVTRVSVPYGQMDTSIGLLQSYRNTWYTTVVLPGGGTRCVSWGGPGPGGNVADLVSCTGINEGWDLVGNRLDGSGNSRAVMLRNGGFVELGTLGGASSRVIAINNRSQAIGMSQTGSGESRPFIWSTSTAFPNGAISGLGALPLNATVTSLNDRGQIVGYFTASFYSRAFIWEAGQYRTLQTLTGLGETASDINIHGQVVGSSTGAGFTWFNDQSHLLTNLIDPDDPLRLVTQVRTVTAINDFGQIVGTATINGVNRQIRLDPVTPK
jgi:hypothetical protein